MNNVGLVPGSYSSKIKIELKPEIQSFDALKIILNHLFHTITVNERGVIDDIDTEFLHDFRVAVRRTRSALSQVKNVFSEEDYKKAKQNFRYLGRITNEMRDMDVYILKEHEYKNLLPENLAEAINPFFDFLRKNRSKELTKLKRNLKSAKYQNIKDEWICFLDSGGSKG